MFSRTAVALATVTVFSLPALADDSTLILAENREFQQMMPGMDFTVVSGDPAGETSTLLIRLAPGYPGLFHTHSSSYTAVVVKGQHKHWDEGQSADDVPVLMPGDTFQQPAEAVHRDANPGDEPSLIFVTMHGPLDFHPHK